MYGTSPYNAASLTTLWHHVDPNHSVVSRLLCTHAHEHLQTLEPWHNIKFSWMCSGLNVKGSDKCQWQTFLVQGCLLGVDMLENVILDPLFGLLCSVCGTCDGYHILAIFFLAILTVSDLCRGAAVSNKDIKTTFVLKNEQDQGAINYQLLAHRLLFIFVYFVILS